MKKINLALFLLLFSHLVWSGELYTSNPVLNGDNGKIVVMARFNTPESGDMYIITLIDNNILFFNKMSGWNNFPVPFIANSTFQGEYTVFSVDAKQMAPGNYQLFLIVTVVDGEPLDSNDWIGGLDGLSSVNFNVSVPFEALSQVKVLAFNDLGMHCMDKEFSIFSILPPFNVVNAQVVGQRNDGSPQLLKSNEVELRYSAITDNKGSINSTSIDKTDFWQYASDLFGVNLQPGQGLTGLYMPADHPQNPGPQPFHYNTQHGWYSADGIPITPVDDADQINTYPMLRISAYKNGTLLGETDVVVPVAMETDCQNCHATGEMAANDPTIPWADDDDLEVQTKKNVLILHDEQNQTDLQNQTPVLCASCHYSPPLDLAGEGPQGPQKDLPTSSQVMHKFHGELRDTDGNLIFPNDAPVEQTCYQCHPGKQTQCQRGAMKTANLECNACHGGMLAVGGKFRLRKGGSLDGKNDRGKRRAWVDLPRCQSCHTGDAVRHLKGKKLVFHDDGIRLRQAYKTGDKSASPLLAKNRRFAENKNTLFRNSKGHGKVACEGCHGSPHAIWPNADANANDNVTATQLQGHVGTIIECDTCHAPGSLEMTTKGPHGLHNVNDPRWVDEEHEEFYEHDAKGCKACHGKNLEGTPLSKVAAKRRFKVEDDIVTLQKGEEVSCDLCHEKPD
ncbi:MAG: hypothetical protein ABFS56_19730 [Pseudomonadota bacterium]